MSAISHRIPVVAGSAFNGREIDRMRPLEFRLNGQLIHGFEGDTVLSATLASGITSAGNHLGNTLALDQNLGLCVKLKGADDAPDQALPIERTPAINGVDLQTYGQQPLPRGLGWLQRLTDNKPETLGLDFDGGSIVPGPVLAVETSVYEDADVIVIGSGIAGLSAAIQAAKRGKQVILIEKRPFLGGDAVLFGHRSGEPAPQSLLDDMIGTLTRETRIRVFTRTEALRLGKGKAHAHQVVIRNGVPVAQALELRADGIVVATGAQDRLPLFGGNRLPGVMALGAAFEMAYAYGVGFGDGTSIITNNNLGYRMGVLLADAGVAVTKTMDTRISPKSRFSEFAKASGVKSELGVTPLVVTKSSKARTLFLKMELSWNATNESPTPIPVEALIVSGGWVKRLGLVSGGNGTLQADEEGMISAQNLAPGISIAGYAAGYESNAAIVESGSTAIDQLLGLPAGIILDIPVDTAFESPEGKLPISRASVDDKTPTVYLDQGPSLIHVQPKLKPRLFAGFSNKIIRHDAASVAERAISLGDLSAMVVLKQIGAAEFDVFCLERSVAQLLFSGSEKHENAIVAATEKEPTAIAPYLKDRFGASAVLRRIDGDQAPQFEQGNLLFTNSDTHDPAKALGVIIRTDKDAGAIALVGQALDSAGTRVLVKGARGHMTAIVSDLV